jgi:hypothetical protein
MVSKLHRAPTDQLFFYEATPHFDTGARRAPGIPAFGLKMDSVAHAFYSLADLKGPIRSNARATRYFFIDPSIEPYSITRIQFSNLVFDLFGIHKEVQIETSASNYSMYGEVLDPW